MLPPKVLFPDLLWMKGPHDCCKRATRVLQLIWASCMLAESSNLLPEEEEAILLIIKKYIFDKIQTVIFLQSEMTPCYIR